MLSNIERLDSEISKTEQQINNLKKPKKIDIHHSSNISLNNSLNNSMNKFNNKNIIQMIYEENSEKVQNSHDELSGLVPSHLHDLYKRPSDLEIYHENIEKNNKIRVSLIYSIIF